MARFIRAVMRDTTFHRLYRARVEADHGDGSFDLLPEAPELEGLGLKHVRARVGVAGAQVLANPGTYCLIGFANGDPRHPHIAAWEYRQHSAIVKLGSGTAPAARYGDVLKVLTEPELAVSGVLEGTADVPNPSPPPLTIPTPVLSSPFTALVTIVGDIHGVVQTGDNRTRA